jgi:hypothetical protein
MEQDSRSEGISPFHGEACLADLWGIRGSDAGELRADVVDDIEIAVGSVVVSQADIGTDCLGVRRVHLNEAGEGQKAIEGIVPLQAGQDNGEIAIGQRQPKTIPRFGG